MLRVWTSIIGGTNLAKKNGDRFSKLEAVIDAASELENPAATLIALGVAIAAAEKQDLGKAIDNAASKMRYLIG